MNADHEEAVEFAKVSKRENRVYVGNLSYEVRYRDLMEFMRGGGWGIISFFFGVWFGWFGQSRGSRETEGGRAFAGNASHLARAWLFHVAPPGRQCRGGGRSFCFSWSKGRRWWTGSVHVHFFAFSHCWKLVELSRGY
jgi:hypothetical protein